MRLIDADSVLDWLEENWPQNWTDTAAEIQEESDFTWFKDMINAQPTITNVEDVVEDEWVPGDKMPSYPRIPYISGKHYCSHCEMPAITHDSLGVYYGKVVFQEYLTPRCPYCGAKMKDAE